MRRGGARRFAYRLALHLGCSNVDAMLRGMTSKQFHEWVQFAEFEPFGETREDARAASIVRVLMNVHRNTKFHPSPFELHDCVLPGGDAYEEMQKPKQQTWQDMKAIGMQAVAASRLKKES